MGTRTDIAAARLRRRSPPPTAHRLAAWLSVARDVGATYFPPAEDDVDALQRVWSWRLAELRAAGVRALRDAGAFARAADCKPYAFAYAGPGERCRLSFCPFCNAADAAAAFERVRRVVRRHGKEVGFLVNQVTGGVDVDSLAHGPEAAFDRCRESRGEDLRWPLLPPGEAKGTLLKYTAWPTQRWNGAPMAALAARALFVVPRAQARLVYEAHRKLKAIRKAYPGQRFFWDQLRELGLGPEAEDALCSGNYEVRPARVSLANAVAHVFQFPAALLTAPAEAAAEVINRTAGHHMSKVRGAFRSPLPINPRLFPLEFVPTDPVRAGFAGLAWSLTPEPPEGPLARELARLLGQPAADTFAALSARLGFPMYWLGRVDVTGRDLLGRTQTKKSALYQAVAKHRPPRPGRCHALVAVHPEVGPIVFSSWTTDPWAKQWVLFREHKEEIGYHDVRIRGRAYVLELADSFAERLRFAAGAGLFGGHLGSPRPRAAGPSAAGIVSGLPG